MVNIITGKINSGKTTHLLQIYKELGIGDGIVLKKVYQGDRYSGQEIERFSTGERIRFSVLKEFIKASDEIAFEFFDYSFYQDGLEFADKVISEMIEREVVPVFIDEIGPVELLGKGFCESFKRLLQSNRDIYVVIREQCVESVIKFFGISRERINIVDQLR